jgi:predicted membrane protein
LVGVLFLLENFGLVHVRRLWEYWPVILIAWGIASATSSRHGGRLWGSMVAIAGVILLLGNLHIIDQSIWRFIWPLFLIGVGLRILYRTARRRRRWENVNPPDGPPPEGGAPAGSSPVGGYPSPPIRGSEPGRLEEWAIFGGSRRRVDSQDFKGGDVFAMFGGIELDLRSAAITRDEVVIDASAVFGGVDIQVPESWNVIVEGHGFFGGYEDKTLHSMQDSAHPRVVITGSAIFGGVVVKT